MLFILKFEKSLMVVATIKPINTNNFLLFPKMGILFLKRKLKVKIKDPTGQKKNNFMLL